MIASAQTEVEGEVSGEWTAEDSPYIVVDSTWVPEEESLMLREGVEVQFLEGQGLYIFGTLDATGAEEDSVLIRVADEVEHWRGLRFYGRNSTEWNYASIVCPDSAFTFDQYCSLTMNNCLVSADRTFAGDSYSGMWGCNLSFSYSNLYYRSFHVAVGGRLTADHTTFDFGEDEDDQPGFVTEGVTFRLTNCEIIGRLTNNWGAAYVDSCRFLRTPHGDQHTGLGIGLGRMTESYVEGGVGAGSRYSETMVTFHNNTLFGSLALAGTVDVLNCDIGESIRVNSGINITIRNSIIRKRLLLRNTESVTVDSCFIIPDDQEEHSLIVVDVSQFEFTRNVMLHLSFISIFYEVRTIFDHNTIVFDSTRRGAIVDISQDLLMTNNIFLSELPGGRLFTQLSLPLIEYNCVWGFDIAAGPSDDLILIEDIDSTNVIANPLIEWEGIIPYISYNSPCRDVGDPEFDLDPDGSRSDIGAIAFDPRFSVHEPFKEVNFPESLNVTAFPNPFNSSTTIRFELPHTSQVSITLTDLTGRRIATLLDDRLTAGNHHLTWDAKDYPAGMYLCKMRADGFSRTKKLVLVK
ncbi:T9SS type A sorting domain-containing protein [bacterium]|nr:T9SS type A sorting domain-containing protein [bacterium]